MHGRGGWSKELVALGDIHYSQDTIRELSVWSLACCSRTFAGTMAALWVAERRHRGSGLEVAAAAVPRGPPARGGQDEGDGAARPRLDEVLRQLRARSRRPS